MTSVRKSGVRRPNELKIQPDGDVKQQVAALLSVICYARDEARRLNADVLAFCLDMAVMTARQDQFCGTSTTEPVAHPMSDSEQAHSVADAPARAESLGRLH